MLIASYIPGTVLWEFSLLLLINFKYLSKSVGDFDLGWHIGLKVLPKVSSLWYELVNFFILSTSGAEYSVIYKSQLTLVAVEWRYFLWQSFLHLQELENRLRLQDGTLKKILALAKSIKQNTSSVGQKIIKDDIKSLKCKQKDLENRLESAVQETENCLNSILKSKRSTEQKEKFTLPGREEEVTSDGQEPTQDSTALEKFEEDRDTNTVSACRYILKTSRLRMKRCWALTRGWWIKPSDFIIKPSMCWLFTMPTCKKSP